MPTFKDYFQLHFIVLIWGFTAILGLYIHVSSLALVFYRTLIASVLLVFVLWATGKSFHVKRQELLKILGTGVLIALHWIFFFGSAKVSNASVCLAGMTTATLWTSLLEPMWMRRKMSRFEIALGLVIILGLYIIFRFEFNHVLGLGMAVMSAFLGTLFSLANADLIKKHDHWVITFYEMIGAWITATLFLGFYMLYQPSYAFPVVPTWQDWFCLFLLGGICTVYAYSIGVKLMKKFTPFAINLTVNLEPVYGIVLAFFLFGKSEKMETGFYVGTAIILLAVFSYPLLKNYFAHMKRKRILRAIEERKSKKEKNIMVAAMVLILLFLGQCTNSSEAYLKKGRELLQSQKFEEAKEYFNKAIAQNAQNAEAFNARGVAFFNLNDAENALLDYNQAIKLNDKLYKAYHNRAMLHTAKSKFDEALQDYGKAIALKPDTSSLYSSRGSLYFRMESIDKALEDFDKAIKLNPKDKEAIFTRGSIKFKQEKYKEAIFDYKRYLQLDDKLPYAYYALGVAQILAGEKDKDAGCQNLAQAQKMNEKRAEDAIKKYCKN
ncbi:MAG: tetratricopeptide repeat protein [Bacteroidetes bacterium]|nr:MAG: tetratricopeptide repeat protein [Bacteroidota bacterium]